MTADKVVFNMGAGNTASDRSYISQSVSGLSQGSTYTLSLWVKGTSGEKFLVRGVGNTTYKEHIFSGVWEHISVPENAASTVSSIEIGTRGGVGGTQAFTCWLWGVQLEALPFASSYIPTTSATVTRVADRCTFPLTDNMVKVQQSKGYTFLFDVILSGKFSKTEQVMLGCDGGLIYLAGFFANDMYMMNPKGGGATTLPGVSMTNMHRYGFVYDGSASKFYIDGEQKGTADYYISTGEILSTLYIGSRVSTSYLYGTISNLRIYDRALTAEEVRLA